MVVNKSSPNCDSFELDRNNYVHVVEPSPGPGKHAAVLAFDVYIENIPVQSRVEVAFQSEKENDIPFYVARFHRATDGSTPSFQHVQFVVPTGYAQPAEEILINSPFDTPIQLYDGDGLMVQILNHDQIRDDIVRVRVNIVYVIVADLAESAKVTTTPK